MNVIGVPKQISQVKYIGELLDELTKAKESFSNIAIVLGDENLLIPLLNSIPKQINAINITPLQIPKYFLLTQPPYLLFSKILSNR